MHILAILSIILCLLVFISSVSATDIDTNDTEILSASDNEEILSVEYDLADTNSDLANVNSDLADTNSDLANVDSDLADTNSDLTSDDLNLNSKSNNILTDSINADKMPLGDGDSSPSTFIDLQKEIDNAPVGSVLTLTRDYYGNGNEQMTLFSNLTIDGNGHTIDCYGLAGFTAFFATGEYITLKNLKIVNKNTKNYYGGYRGGVITVDGPAHLTIINCLFENNSAKKNGGAIYVMNDKPLTIINSTFNYNTVVGEAGYGGAIYSASDITLFNSTFDTNLAFCEGGAIYGEKV